MVKRKVIRKSNRPFTYNPHYYSWGGDFTKSIGGNPFKGAFSGTAVGNIAKGAAGALGSAVGSIAGGAIGGGLSSGAGNAISSVGSTIGGLVGTVNPVLGGIVSAGTGILGGLTNRMFGSKLNNEKIAEIESNNKALNNVLVDNSSLDSIENQWANQDFGTDFSKSDIGSDGWFSNKAKNKYKKLKKQQDIARSRALTSYDNAADAADTQSDLNAIANYAAFGGLLDTFNNYGDGAIGYELNKENLGIKALNALSKNKISSLPNYGINTFADGGNIHIKPSKKGTFTAAAKKHGKSVQAFASQVLANKENYSPAMVKKANFARNAAKWHSFGGDLNTNGADFSNGQVIIGNGGTHEDNIYEGVPMGMDAEGTPNLVEQGEVIFNDYVFSNRLFADKKLLDSVNLPKSYDGYSFAAIAEKLGKESKERPNDPISKRGLLNSMSKLQQAQEIVRGQQQENSNNNKYATGGYAPSDNIKNKIIDWEGSSMKTNRSFEDEARDFNRYLSPELQSKLNPNQLDALYSYGYNVGMGRLRDRVLPTLTAYTQGNATLQDVQNSMWASKDNKYRGLMNRRQYERNLFGTPISNNTIDTLITTPDNTTGNLGLNNELKEWRQELQNGYIPGVDSNGKWVEEPKYMARAAAKRAGHDVGEDLDAYNENPVENPVSKGIFDNIDTTYLRYAPVVGAAIGIGQNLFSRPDYYTSNAILEAANQSGDYIPVDYDPIGNYLQYKPLDRNYYMSRLNAQAGATRRAIMNSTSPSRNASLLAADYNNQLATGNLARQAEEYNLAQRQAVEQFNRGTNQANSEMGLQAAMANQRALMNTRNARLSGIAQAMALRNDIDARRAASMSANLTNFFNSLGDIGREEYSKNMVMSNPALYYSIDNKGNITYKNGYEDLSEAEKKEVRNAANKTKKKRKAKGGYLTIKKK